MERSNPADTADYVSGDSKADTAIAAIFDVFSEYHDRFIARDLYKILQTFNADDCRKVQRDRLREKKAK